MQGSILTKNQNLCAKIFPNLWSNYLGSQNLQDYISGNSNVQHTKLDILSYFFFTMSSHFDTPTLKGSKLDIKICKIRFLGTVMYNILNWTFLPILIHCALARRCSDHERFKSAKSPLTVTRRRSYELKGKSKVLSRLFSLCRVQMKTFQLNTIVLIR